MADVGVAEQQEQIIAALCAEAPSVIIRNCLRKYEQSKTSWQIERAMSAEKKATLVETLTYLGVPNMANCNKTGLPHELVCRVQNLFPDTCGLCNESYCVKLNDKPIVSCARCGQGCHNKCVLQLLGKTEDDLTETNKFGETLLNPYAAIGLFYFCSHCKKEAIPEKQELKNKKSSNVAASQQNDPQLLNSEQNTASIVRNESSSQTDLTTNDDEHHQQIDLQVENSQQNSGLTQSVTTPTISDQTRETSICKFYRQGRCVHGVSGKKEGNCRFNHPKPCRKFLANGTNRRRGCIRGENCTNFHPQMCFASLKERVCLRNDCKFMHIKGTKRYGEPEGLQPPREQVPSWNPPPLMDSTSHARNQTQHQRASQATMASQPQNRDLFLDHLKSMEAQLLKITDKLLQLDSNYNHLIQHGPIQSKMYQTYPISPYNQNPLIQPSPVHQYHNLGMSQAVQTR